MFRSSLNHYRISVGDNGYEFVLVLAACAAALAIAGPGAASIDDLIARRRPPTP